MAIGKSSNTKKKPTTKPTTKAKTKTAPAFKADLFGESGEEDLQDMAINLVGLPAASKTFTALSIDPAWPKCKDGVLERQRKKVLLERVLHIGYDRSALVGLSQFNTAVQWRVNIPQIMGRKDWDIRDATMFAIEEAGELIERYQLEACIIDTVTRYDRFIFAHWFSEEHIPLTRGDEENTMAAYGKMFRDHHMLQSFVMAMPLRPIFCFHLKALAPLTGRDEAKKSQKTKQMLQAGESGATLVPAVTGSASEVYFGDASLEITCRAFKSPSSGKMCYELRPNGYKEIRGKNRLRAVLKDVEPPDLRALIKKVGL